MSECVCVCVCVCVQPSSSRGESLRETLTVIAAELSGESDGVHFESVGPGVTVRAVAHFER